MIFDVSHKTQYRYSSPVVQSQHLVHMSPRHVERQIIRNHSLIVEPAPAMRTEGRDAFGNPIALLDIEVPHKELVLHARSTIEVTERPPADPAATLAWDALDTELSPEAGPVDLDVVQYRCGSRLASASLDIAAYADDSFARGRPVLAAAFDLIGRIKREFVFDPAATDVSTPVQTVLKLRRGVCQDFSHLALACLRAKRIPARYVSGYILTHPPPGRPKLQGTDASHAWISVWCPPVGWIDLDPTNGTIVSGEHVAIAYGRDYDDVSPISGVLIGGGQHTVSVSVDVNPLP